jgi:hypothetical protein
MPTNVAKTSFGLLNLETVDDLEVFFRHAFDAGKFSPNEALAVLQKCAAHVEITKAQATPAWPKDMGKDPRQDHVLQTRLYTANGR